MTRFPTRAVSPAAMMTFACMLNLFAVGTRTYARSGSVSVANPDSTLPGQGTGLSGLGKGPAPVSLGMAGDYVILAKTGVSMTGTTSVTGDIGLSPAAGSYITGFSLLAPPSTFATSAAVTGKVYASDYDSPTPSNLTTAVSNSLTAFTDAAGRAPDYSELGAGSIGGKTLAPATYKWGTDVLIPADVTLAGGPNDVWIFQVAGDLKEASGVSITLAGGALAKNIFWQVAGAVDLETTAHFEGVVLCQTAIILKTGASANSRFLAQTAVVLDANAVVQPAAGAPLPGTLKGTVKNGNAVIPHALVVLRRGSDSAAIMDSVRSDSAGVYVFANVASNTPNYWVTATTAFGTATLQQIAVPAGATVTADFTFMPSALRPLVSGGSRAIRVVRTGDRMAMQLDASASARTVSIFASNGRLRDRVSVPAGMTKVEVPGVFSPSQGFHFQVK